MYIIFGMEDGIIMVIMDGIIIIIIIVIIIMDDCWMRMNKSFMKIQQRMLVIKLNDVDVFL